MRSEHGVRFPPRRSADTGESRIAAARHQPALRSRRVGSGGSGRCPPRCMSGGRSSGGGAIRRLLRTGTHCSTPSPPKTTPRSRRRARPSPRRQAQGVWSQRAAWPCPMGHSPKGLRQFSARLMLPSRQPGGHRKVGRDMVGGQISSSPGALNTHSLPSIASEYCVRASGRPSKNSSCPCFLRD